VPAPTKKQWVGYPLMNESAITTTHVRLPNPAEAGDTIIITGQFGSGSDVISAIADDQGGSLAGGQWVKDKIQANAGNGQSVCILRRSNCPAGTRSITITFSGATNFTQFGGLLVNNLATSSPVDGTASGGNPTGLTLAAGSITSTQTNDFVVFVGAETAGATTSALTRFTAPANYTLWAPDGLFEFCCMYGTQASIGAFNPTLTSSRSWSASACAAVAYKTTTSGGVLNTTTAEVRQVQCMNFNSAKVTLGTTLTFDMPCPSGINAIAFAYDDGSGIFQAAPASNTASSPSNTWSATPSTQAGSPPTGAFCGFVYKTDAAVSETGSLTLTVTNAPTSTGFPFEVYIWAMANIGAFDARASGAGTLATTPPVTQTNVLSPALATAADQALILFFNQEESQTVTDIASSTGAMRTMMPDNGAYESLRAVHDAGFGHVKELSPTTSNFDISWSEYEGNGDVVGPWCAQAISFTGIPPPLPPKDRGRFAANSRRG
jgi:hypothetical protein